MTKEIRERRNEGKHLKTLCMNKNKFIIKSVDSAIMMGVDEPDIYVSLVESGHTYEIYVKYTNIVTQETYERSCGFVVGFMPDTNLCYDVYVTDTGVKINTEVAQGDADVLGIHACGELPELCAVIELIDVSNIWKDLKSKNDTKTETDEHVYAKSDNTEIPSTQVFRAPYNKTPEDQTKIFIAFLKDRLQDQHFSKLNEKIDKAEEDSKETTSDKDEKPNFTSEVDPHLRDKEYQAALMAELIKQRLSSLGLSIVNTDGSTVDIDECLSTDEPWKTFQPTGVHYTHDGSLDAYGIYDVGDEGIDDLNDRIRKMICDIKDAERLVKRIRTENEDLIDKFEELKTTTTYPHILDINNHCFNTADDIMVRVELREKVSHITYTVGTVYFRKDDHYGYRMIFSEDGQYEMKVIDEDFLKDHPMIPGLDSLYVDTDQIPKQMRENLEMVVSELVDRHIHPYSRDFIECLNVIPGWLREAHKNLKGTKRARKQIIKALKD